VPLQFQADGPGSVPNARRLGAKLGNVQHFLDVAQAVGPLSVLDTGDGATPTSTAVRPAKLVEEILQDILPATFTPRLAAATGLTGLLTITPGFRLLTFAAPNSSLIR